MLVFFLLVVVAFFSSTPFLLFVADGLVSDEELLLAAVTLELEVDSSACKGICARRGAGYIRHIETPTLWLQQAVSRKRLKVNKVPGTKNPADLGTEILTGAGIRKHLYCLNLRFVTGTAKTQLTAAGATQP